MIKLGDQPVIPPESPESFKQPINTLIREARMELSQYELKYKTLALTKY